MPASPKLLQAVAAVPIGSTVSFLAGPTRIPVTAEVTGHDGQFVVTKDASGRVRKTRPGAIKS